MPEVIWMQSRAPREDASLADRHPDLPGLDPAVVSSPICCVPSVLRRNMSLLCSASVRGTCRRVPAQRGDKAEGGFLFYEPRSIRASADECSKLTFSIYVPVSPDQAGHGEPRRTCQELE